MRYWYLFLLVALFILVVPSSAWVTGYYYRTGHYINGSDSGAQTDYQVMLNVSNTAGTSTGDLHYLQGHGLNFPNDLRFTDTSDNQWDYWIESNNATYATVWIEVPSIPSGSTNQVEMYIYYGNSTVTSTSNGENTFSLLFDHFDGTSINTSKWIIGSTSANIVNSELNITGANANIRSQQNFVYNTSVRIKARFLANYQSWMGYYNSTTDKGHRFISDSLYADHYQSISYDGVNISSFDWGGSYTGNHTWDLTKNYTYSLIYNIDSENKHTATTGLTTYPHKIYFYSSFANSILFCDYTFVHAYIFPEPTHFTYSPEESAPCTANFIGTPLSGDVPLSVQFTDLSSSGKYPLYYTWDFGDGSPASYLQNPAHTYTTTGTYDVKLKVTNGPNTDWENKTAYITAGNATTPTPTPTPSPTFTYLTPTPTPTAYPTPWGNNTFWLEDYNSSYVVWGAMGLPNLTVDGIIYEINVTSAYFIPLYGLSPGSVHTASNWTTTLSVTLPDDPEGWIWPWAILGLIFLFIAIGSRIPLLLVLPVFMSTASLISYLPTLSVGLQYLYPAYVLSLAAAFLAGWWGMR